ncbi:hypothetical protein [Aestuariimicrobium sp. p3-SID1156]|nr:hypothetical protein [Aestuariimicrobium sp. p3-SID1156]
MRSQFGIVPAGPDEAGWLTPHGREALSGAPVFRRHTPQEQD